MFLGHVAALGLLEHDLGLCSLFLLVFGDLMDK